MTENKDTENFLNSFNDVQVENEVKWIKINELKIGKKYEIILSKKIETKFGDPIIIIANKKGDDRRLGMYLPKRYNTLSDEQIKKLTGFYITYVGSNDRSESKYINADNIIFTSRK
jgi:hypothetical protein